MSETERMRPDSATRTAEREEIEMPIAAGPGPTSEEEAAADEAKSSLDASGESAEVAQHYEEMIERGAHQQGEGRP
jgi:hypothetical protein